jgi:hypothetical protein
MVGAQRLDSVARLVGALHRNRRLQDSSIKHSTACVSISLPFFVGLSADVEKMLPGS